MIRNSQINGKLSKNKDKKVISFTDERLDAYEQGRSKNEKKVEEMKEKKLRSNKARFILRNSVREELVF